MLKRKEKGLEGSGGLSCHRHVLRQVGRLAEEECEVSQEAAMTGTQVAGENPWSGERVVGAV